MSSLWKIAAHWNRAPVMGVGLAVDLALEHVDLNSHNSQKGYQDLGGNRPCII